MSKFLPSILWVVLAGVCFSSPAFAQQDYRVRFLNHTEIFPENMALPPAAAPGEAVGGVVFRYLQFQQVPNAAARAEMSAAGVRFFGYVHFGAYLVGLPENFDLKKLAKHAPRSLVAVAPEWRIAPNLRERPFPAYAQVGDQIEVHAQAFPSVSIAEAADLCRKQGLTVTFEGRQNGLLTLRFFPDDLPLVAALPFIQWLELVPPPGEKEDTGGRSLHRSNLVDSDAPMGRKYNGAGIKVLTRDDGVVGPHLDFRGRLNNLTLSRPGQTHGDGVSGIMAGAGNIDPTQKGMAAGADLYVLDYANHFQDTTLPLHQLSGIKITNSSYSDGCNVGYTTASQTVDNQIFENPGLMHVFSAGNMGNVDCSYGAGAVWGNITGGHKMAKNAIATANLYADFALEVTSSRGPAYDGRLKPDIAAHGQNQGSTTENHEYQVFGGTSGAAPGIAGCLAQLSQAFSAIENGEDAPTALLKAAMLNTANDMGNVGPDFKYGWGHVNAWRALRLLEEKRWLRGSAEQGSQQTFVLQIPAGVRQARAMVYWADPEAAPNASRALINDLDIKVLDPAGAATLPLVLDETPSPTALNALAKPGADHLNNMEQVRLENPAPGNYTIEIAGYEVPFGPQQFYLVWEFLTDETQITYPAGGEHFVPGETERIHWDAHGETGDFTLRFSPDGAAWQDVATVAASKRFYEWTVPNTLTANAKLQIVRGGNASEMAAPFHIMRVPGGLQMLKVCPDSITVGWAKVADTLAYEVLVPGAKYMELAGRTTALQYTLPIQGDAGEEQFFTVRATSADGGIVGRRAYAFRYSGGLLNCPQPFDAATLDIPAPGGTSIVSCGPVQQPVTITVRNEGQNAIVGASASYQTNNDTPVTENLPDVAVGETLDFTFQQPVSLTGAGTLSLRVWTNLASDLVVFNDTLAKTLPVFTDPKTGLHTQNFQTGPFPQTGWRVENPDASVTWASSTAIQAGINGNPTTAVYLNCFSYNKKGEEDYLYMVPTRLTGIAKPGLAFDLAHARFGGSTTERLRVEVFADCDLTAAPVVVYDKADPDLSTTTNTQTNFFPNSGGDWRTEIVDLQQFAGQTIIVRFVGVNDFGNNIFIDNVRTVEYNVTPPAAAFTFDEPSICRGDTVLITSQATGNYLTYRWIFGAQAVPASADSKGPHEVKYITPGTKKVRLIVSNSLGADTLEQNFTVLGLAFANFTQTMNQNTVQFNNTSTYADAYLWDFGDGQTSTEASPTHTYATTGTFTAKLAATNPCKTAEKSVLITISTIGSEEALPGGARAQIVPNPTAGDFAVAIQSPRAETLRLELLDAQGRVVRAQEAAAQVGKTLVPFAGLNLSAGVYQLKISDLSGFRTLRVVVQ